MSRNYFKMENLKKLRENKHMTQVKLSTEIELSQEIISHYELGQCKPNVDNLIKLADYFNCSTDYLLNRTNNPLAISDLSKNELQLNDILKKYKALPIEKQKQFISYLDYLTNSN